MNKKRILFLSAYFPNPTAPNIATYNKQQLLALTEYYDIDAIVPIPWTHRISNRNISQDSLIGKVNIKYPTYFYSPFILRSLYGYYYYHSIIKTVAEVTAKKSFDIIYSSWLYPDAWAAAKIARQCHLPLFVSVLGTDVNRLNINSYLSHRALDVADYALKIMCVSKSLRDKLISVGCNQDKLFVLQNGIDHKIFYPMNKNSIRNEIGISSNEKVILFVGNLKKEKGLRELCHAFSNLIKKYFLLDCRLVVIGGGKFRLSLERLLAELNVLDKAIILGERSLETIAKYMNACDVLCLPSYSEGQPNVVMEALSCHTRVVATTVGGTPDLDDGYGNIRLVPPKAVPELTNALLGMLDNVNTCYEWRRFNTWADNAAYLHNVFEMASTIET